MRNFDCAAKDFLLLYINSPCIVLGKNQCIYREVNFEYLRNNKLPVARRVTGGGAVYHDAGNLNFSFITKFTDEKINNYKLLNGPLVQALKKAGIDAYMDERNNILCGGLKISGNAQFTDRKNIISHGTLLFDANLETLRGSLKENDFSIETKAVSSVRSKVANVKSFNSRFNSINELRTYLVDELCGSETYKLSESETNAVEKLATEKFKTYEWVYGRSPLTVLHKGNYKVEVEHGVMAKIEGGKAESFNLIGAEYSYEGIKKALGDVPGASDILREIF